MEEGEEKNTQLDMIRSSSAQLEFGEEIKHLIKTAGTLIITDDEKKDLYAPVRDEEIILKPDGKIYLPWTKYAERMNKAFGGVGWTLVPEGPPKIDGNNLVLWGFHLLIRGTYNGYAIGEQQYFDNNKNMSYGEACEGARSNAIMRLCKSIGIGCELWDKTFIKRWLDTYATTEWRIDSKTNQNKKVWLLKTESKNSFDKPGVIKDTTKRDVQKIHSKIKECKTPEDLQKCYKDLSPSEKNSDDIKTIFLNAKKQFTK